MNYNELPSNEVLEKTQSALQANGVNVKIAENSGEAQELAKQLIPQGSEVMTMTSVTLETLGLVDEFNDTTKYQPIRAKFQKLEGDAHAVERQRLGAAPEYAIGSVHAVTQDGKVIIASATGSQLPAYVYGSKHVIWVVGAQKIVKDVQEGLKRIDEYVLPLESERARKAYGVAGSSVSKLLIINQEVNPERITMIIVKDKLGY